MFSSDLYTASISDFKGSQGWYPGTYLPAIRAVDYGPGQHNTLEMSLWKKSSTTPQVVTGIGLPYEALGAEIRRMTRSFEVGCSKSISVDELKLRLLRYGDRSMVALLDTAMEDMMRQCEQENTCSADDKLWEDFMETHGWRK